MTVVLQRFTKFFELHLGWFFINGNKIDQWKKYLACKYNPNKR